MNEVSSKLKNLFCLTFTFTTINFASVQGGSLPRRPLASLACCQGRGVVVRWHTPQVHTASAQNVQDQAGHFASHGISAHGLSIERARLAGGTSLRSWFQKRCPLPAGILIFFPKKVAATWWDFDFFFQKKVARTWWDFYFLTGFTKKVPATFWDFDFFPQKSGC